MEGGGDEFSVYKFLRHKQFIASCVTAFFVSFLKTSFLHAEVSLFDIFSCQRKAALMFWLNTNSQNPSLVLDSSAMPMGERQPIPWVHIGLEEGQFP